MKIVIGLEKNENHLFKWIDEALLDEIQMVDAQQQRLVKDVQDLRENICRTILKEGTKSNNFQNVCCI